MLSRFRKGKPVPELFPHRKCMQVIIDDNPSSALDQLERLYAARDQSRLSFSFIGSSFSLSLVNEHICRIKALSVSRFGESRGLLIITCQRSLQPVIETLKRKKICQSGQATSSWTKELEQNLVAMIREVNLTFMSISVI